MIFTVFQMTLVSFFCFNYSKLFFSKVSKCTIRIMIITIINVNIFAGFLLTVFENKRAFVKKICTAYNHSDAQQSEKLFTRSI